MKIRATKDVLPYWKRDGCVSPEDYAVKNRKHILLMVLREDITDHPDYKIAKSALELGLFEDD